MTARPCCHCERSDAISYRVGQSDGDCFVAPLLAMTTRAKSSSGFRAEAGETAALSAVAVEIAGFEPGLESAAQHGPIAVDDREPRGVAIAAARDHRLPEQPFIGEAEPGGGGAARQVSRNPFPILAAGSPHRPPPARPSR